MSDYKKLVEALRHCTVDAGGFADCRGCPEEGHSFDCETKMHMDAAAAIEALEAKLNKKRMANCWGCKCEKVEPKRGELTADEVETIRIHMNAIKERLCNQNRHNEAEEYQVIVDKLAKMEVQE